MFPNFDSQTTELEDLCGSDSWKFFDLLHIDASFLEQVPNEWDTLDSYKQGVKVARELRVCNDSAEHGVKLAAEFLSSAKSEDVYRNVLQVVENNRKSVPNQRKRRK